MSTRETNLLSASRDEKPNRQPSLPPHDPNQDRAVPTEEKDGDEVVSDWTYDPTPPESPKRKARGSGLSWVPLHGF